MIQVGFQLINTSGEVVRSWGGPRDIVLVPPNPVVLPNGDTVFSPDLNTDYGGYTLVEWMMPAPQPIVPAEVPMWAVRTVLQNDGLFDQAQALIDASTDNALKNVWEYGNVADRSSPAINALGVALGLTDAQIDQMFFDANALIV